MSRHLKRLTAPRTWPIKRKVSKFVTKPNPGRPLGRCIPLNILLKDILGLAKTTREVKKILRYNNLLVDGIRRTDAKFPVGLMDTIKIIEIQKYYRITINKKGKLSPIEIEEAEVNIKPCKIINKSLVKGKTQLNLFDGRNVLVEKNGTPLGYKTADSLLLKLPEQDIKEHIKLGKDSIIFLTDGKHTGEIGTVTDISGKKTKYKLSSGEIVETSTDYVFVIGKEKPSVKVF